MSKKDKKEKISLEEVKKIPPEILLLLINRGKKYLKNNDIMQNAFKEYGIDINEIDLIPTYFADLDVSATTDHGIIYLNYELLCDGDFLKDYSYMLHEYIHFLQQTSGDKPTKGSDDGEYLDNEFEQEAFSNQIGYIADEYGDKEAEEYTDNLLEYHEIDKKDKSNKKEELMAKV